MCWVYPFSHLCYECDAEWDSRTAKIPCRYQEQVDPNGEQCTRRTELEPVVINYETCESCKACRQAEETVQQRIHRIVPLYYDISRRGAIRQNCWLVNSTNNNNPLSFTVLSQDDLLTGQHSDAPGAHKEDSELATEQASSPRPRVISLYRRAALAARASPSTISRQ